MAGMAVARPSECTPDCPPAPAGGFLLNDAPRRSAPALRFGSVGVGLRLRPSVPALADYLTD